METAIDSAFLRVRNNMNNPVHRKNVILLMIGKAIGLAIVFGLLRTIIPQAAHAQGTDPTSDPLATINAVNTAWVLIAAFLVFAMQVGFVMLESGFAREREAVNILAEGIADTCICGIFFWAIAFAVRFEDGNKVIGTYGHFLQGLPASSGYTVLPLLASCVFRFAYAY